MTVAPLRAVIEKVGWRVGLILAWPCGYARVACQQGAIPVDGPTHLTWRTVTWRERTAPGAGSA